MIRPFTIDDYQAVHQLWLATPGLGLNTRDDSPEGIAAYLRRNPRTCFVADAGPTGGIVAAIMAGHDGRRGFIHHTCVAADFRHRGIATQLVDTALDALRAEGIAKVALVVKANNDPGNAFWEHSGFTTRPDLTYRNRGLVELERIDT
jgi:ribosomal protein S18 acetylase RimI-like enzyme